MTITLAQVVQSWFTPLMATHAPTKTNRETITQKAERMIAEGRYEVTRSAPNGAFWVGTCHGEHGDYQVFAVSQETMDKLNVTGGRVACSCRYGRGGKLCSHSTGAEMLRKAGVEWS